MTALNYNHLRYFHAIAHAGGLTRAAEALNLSQSALSVQLKKLEAQIGHPLFDRVGKQLRLNEAGRIALDHADTVFATGDAMLRTLAGRPSLDRQVLRVGALPTLSRNFQFEFVAPLVGRRDVELILRSGTMRDLLLRLDNHEIDVVLATGSAQPDAANGLVDHVLGDQPISLVARSDAGLANFRFPESLAHVPVVLPSLDSEIRQGFDRIMDAAGIRPVVLAEIDDMAMLRLLARESEGATLVPPIVVRDELATGGLVELCSIPGLSERFHAITQKRRFPNPLLGELIARATPQTGTMR